MGGTTNGNNNINNGENNNDDEATVVTTSSSSPLSLRGLVYRIHKSSFPPLLMTPPSVHEVEYCGRWKIKKNEFLFQ